MADSFENPVDQAHMKELEQALKGTEKALKADIAQSKRAEAGEARRQQRQARDENVARRQRSPEARGESGEGPTRGREQAEARLNRQLDERVRLRREELALERRMQPLVPSQRQLPPAGGSSYRRPAIEVPPGGFRQAPGVGSGQPPRPPGGPPRPPAPPTPPPGGGGGPRDPDYVRRIRESQQVTKTASAAEADRTRNVARLNAELRQSVEAHGAAAQSLRAHGALTTEFFSALARGEVRLSEVRYQVGATTAKFAGWTLAASAVYGAVAAMSTAAHGAIDLSTQVNQLDRYINNLDTKEAQTQLIGLSRFFNLPIAETGEAFAKMGQIFHTQAAAFEATKAALYGVTIGEMSVADSTRFLTAIVQGFHLEAGDLAGTFDKLNALQNNYGITIRDSAAGTAKAAGAWHSAGGSLNTFLSIMAVAKRETGRSGEVVGTALQRSAESIYRRPINQESLRGYGIDPTQNIDKIYADAFRLVNSRKVRGRDINKLATALSTPQLSPTISGALQNPDLQKQVLKTVGGDVGKIRRNEFEKFINSAEQKIKRVGIEIGALGANLGSAGAFNAFGLLLETLNLTLGTTNQLLTLFNELPEPLRKAAVYAAEIKLASKAAGALGLANRLTGGGAAIDARAAARENVVFHSGKVEAARVAEKEARYEASKTGAIAAENEAASTNASAKMRAALATNASAASEEAVAAANAELAFAKAGLAEAEALSASVQRKGALSGLAPFAGAGGGFAAGPRAEAARAAAQAKTLAAEEAAAAGTASTGQLARAGAPAAAKGAAAFGSAFTAALLSPMAIVGGVAAAIIGSKLKDIFKDYGKRYDLYGQGARNLDEQKRLLTNKSPSDQAQAAADLELDRITRESDARRAGKPAGEQLLDRIGKDAKTELGRARIGRDSKRKAQQELDRLLKEVDTSEATSDDPKQAKAERDRVRKKIQALRDSLGPGNGRSREDIFKGLDAKDFEKRLQDDAEGIKTFSEEFGKLRSGGIKDVAAGYHVALALVKKNPNSKDNLKRLTAARAAIDGVIGAVTQELDDELKLARSGGERTGAYNQAQQRLAQLPRGRQRRLAQRDLTIKRFEDSQAQGDALLSERQAISPEPAQDAKLAIAETGRQIARAIRVYGRTSKEVRGLIQKQYENYRAAADAQLADIDADTSLAVARAQTPAGERAAQEAGDIRHLEAMRHSGRYSGAEIKEQMAKIAAGRKAIAEAVKDDAKELAQSIIDLKSSRTEDPIKLADYKVEDAITALRYAKTPAERNRALADVNRARRDAKQTRQQEKYDDIQFEFDIGKVDRAGMLQRLRALQKTIKGNRDLKRTIARQIHQLEQDQNGDRDGFALNVDGIRLPTVYDVRRGISQARGQRGATFHNSPNINVTVTDPNSAGAVYSAIENATGSSVRAAARAAGAL